MTDYRSALLAGGRDRPLRIVLVQTCPELSAEARVVYGLLKQLADLGVPPQVLLLQGVSAAQPDSPVPAMFRELPGLVVQTVRMGQLGQYRRHLLDPAIKALDAGLIRLALRGLTQQALAFQPDIVYSAQQLWDMRIATALARAVQRPRVVHLHYLVGAWLGRAALSGLQSAGMVIAISDFVRAGALRYGVAPERICTLHNSTPLPPELSAEERAYRRADLRTELGLRHDSLLLGMVARLTRWKGQEELLRAALPLLAEMPQLALLFAGSEDITGRGLAARLQQLARETGVADRVRLLGHRSDVPTILDALDLFAHPSRDEPFGLAVLEAMAHRLPVVAWAEGGTAEIVLDGVTGFLVEPADLPGLTRALATLLRDEPLRRQMGVDARLRAGREFDPALTAQRFESLLRRAAAGTGPAR
ncbi:MAG TPA: glycosyltransferase family 4 protein [Chloroflexota bacterium]|nr:glycosyltransferase family 4 protein [Chloroflexota bacterium]